MATTTLNKPKTLGKTNTLRTNGEGVLAWAPDVDDSRIGVAATDGVVTLTGHVPSFADRVAAERVTKRVFGVKAVANDLEIDLPGDNKHTDTELAEAAVSALKWNAIVPAGKVKVAVHNGWLTLEGEVDWQYQREAAWNAVRTLVGVKGIDNEIVVKPTVKPNQVKEQIEAALVRDARRDAKNITVGVKDGKVVLRGTVDSWSDREEVEEAAWSVAGCATWRTTSP